MGTTYCVEVESNNGETAYHPVDTRLARVAIAAARAAAALPENAARNVFLAFRQPDGCAGYINADGNADVTGRAYPKA